METLRDILHPAMTILATGAIVAMAYAALHNLCTAVKNTET